MGSMAQTGLLLVPSDALGHTWALPGVVGAGQGLPPPTGPENLKERSVVLAVLVKTKKHFSFFFAQHGAPYSLG